MWKRVCLHDTKMVETDSAAMDVIVSARGGNVQLMVKEQVWCSDLGMSRYENEALDATPFETLQ